MRISFGGAPGTETIFAYMNWSGSDQNSTRVVLGMLSNSSLPCMISGDKVYWNASLVTGDNFFFIERADLNVTRVCNATITPADDNQVALWAAKRLGIFSKARNSNICGQMNGSYSHMKRTIGVTYDFNVVIEEDGALKTCGLKVPRAGRDVFIYPVKGVLYEGGDMDMSVMLW